MSNSQAHNERAQAQQDITSSTESPLPTRKAIISPLFDVLVAGNATDQRPPHNGASHILSITQQLQDAGIPCCVVAESALKYYGAQRIALDWTICVPPDHLSQATILLESQPNTSILTRTTPSPIHDRTGLRAHYPRFKFHSLKLFFILQSSQAHHLTITPSTVEYSKTGIPYPTLACFAQSLLETWNGTDLEDLVDGMSLTTGWGERNLELQRTVDAEWGRWRADLVNGGKASDGQLPGWVENPPVLRGVWERVTSAESKVRRMGLKYKEGMETRFRAVGSADPRDGERLWC